MKKRYIVACPVCGKILFRSAASDMEIQCAKCHCNLSVEIMNQRLTIIEIAKLGIAPLEQQTFYRRRGEAQAV